MGAVQCINTNVKNAQHSFYLVIHTLMKYYFRSEATGVYITSVQEGYNEDVLEYGDRITAIDDVEVNSTADVKEIIAESKVGDELTFTISRKGKLKDVVVTCYEYVPESGVSFEEE